MNLINSAFESLDDTFYPGNSINKEWPVVRFAPEHGPYLLKLFWKKFELGFEMIIFQLGSVGNFNKFFYAEQVLVKC